MAHTIERVEREGGGLPAASPPAGAIAGRVVAVRLVVGGRTGATSRARVADLSQAIEAVVLVGGQVALAVGDGFSLLFAV